MSYNNLYTSDIGGRRNERKIAWGNSFGDIKGWWSGWIR